MSYKLNCKKGLNHVDIEVYEYFSFNLVIWILKTFWFGYRLECKFIEGWAENQLSFINSDLLKQSHQSHKSRNILLVKAKGIAILG